MGLFWMRCQVCWRMEMVAPWMCGLLWMKWWPRWAAKDSMAVNGILFGEGVDGVFHGIGGDDLGVVAGDVGLFEGAFELDAHRKFVELVAVGVARDFGEANGGFAVDVMGEDCHEVLL